MDKKEATIQVQSLINQFGLNSKDLGFIDSKEQGGSTGKFIKINPTAILSYIGALFLLFGILFITSIYWSSLSQISRVVLVLGTGIISFAIAIIFATKKNFTHFSSGFYGISSFLIPAGIFILLDLLISDSYTSWKLLSCFVFSGLSIYYFLCDRYFKNNILHLFGWVYISTALGSLILYLAQNYPDTPYRVWSFSIYLLATIILLVARYQSKNRPFVSHVMEIFTIPVYLLSTASVMMSRRLFDLLYIAVVLMVFYVGYKLERKAYLIYGFLSLIIYLQYINSKYFANTVSWPIFLIIFGTASLGIAGYFQSKSKAKN